MRMIISLSGTTPILKWRGCFLSHFGVFFFFLGGGGGFWSHLGCLDGRYYTCPFRYHLVLCIKKLTKKCHWPHRNLPNAPTTGIRGGGDRWLRRHSVNSDSPHTPLFQRNSNAPINVNPVGRECGQRTGIWCLRLSPRRAFDRAKRSRGRNIWLWPTEAWYQFRSGYQVRPSRLSESHAVGERCEVFICFHRHNPIL